ncbi:exocyst complex component 7-like isoform X2 [Tachypleus tridentatus]|uniref:exocyst complex component 7-like isoform X2 n=1 Tax=Tachypleus tridentatus TaxID=6853 RepID=UPI003FD62D80
MDCLEEFLKSVDKLQKAIDYFDKHNPNSPELVTLMSLFDAGGDALEREFRGLLSRHSKPMPPVLILDLVGMDDELPSEEEKHVVDQLPEKTVRDLTKIAEWLRKNRNEDFANIYATIRSSILQKSLQGLRDHQKACSGNSISLTVQNSPLLGGRRSGVRETPPRRVSKRIQQALKKKASAAFMKYSPSVDTAFGQRFHPSLLPEMKDEILEQEIESYLTSVTALYKLMQNLASRVKKCVARHEFSAALSLFPILRHLSDMKPEFDRIFDGCTTAVRNKLQGLLVNLQTTIHKALEEFIDSIKNDPDTKLPKDGTVHELNSNVMMLLEQLLDYTDMLGSVLTVSDIGAAREAKDPSKLALAQYIYRVLSALGLALTTKSESYNDPYLKAIFRMNNLHYIQKTLQNSGLLDIVHLYNDNVGEHYNDEIRDQKRIYSQSWSRVLHYVMEVDRPISQQRGSNGHSSLKKASNSCKIFR